MFLADDLASLTQRSEQRQSPVSDMIASGLVVEEPDDFESEFPVLQHFVGDELSKITRPRNQHALQANPGLPATLERLAHEFARRVCKDDIDNQVERPDEL